jgi:hypothetical protein
LIKTSKSGKRKLSRLPNDAVAIGNPPFGNDASPRREAKTHKKNDRYS